MTEPLPDFPYHPDPLATGVVVERPVDCAVCGQRRELAYVGPVFSVDREIGGPVCPWCIADGSAAARFGASFGDSGEVVPDDVAKDVVTEIEERTPGVPGWQEHSWMYHCGDGAAFLGAVGRSELDAHPDAIDHIRGRCRDWGWSEDFVRRFVDSLSAEGALAAYLFRCRHCGRHLAYADLG